MERRSSIRLKNIPESKRPYYGPSDTSLIVQCPKNKSTSKPRKASNVQVNVTKGSSESKLKNEPEIGAAQIESGEMISSPLVNTIAESEQNNGTIEMTISDKGAYARVKETLQVYNSHYLHFVQEKEKATAKGAVQGVKRKKTKTGEVVVKRSVDRFDLQATSKMLNDKEILYPQKKIGNLPGVDVGFRFFSRAEMVAVGFHGHWLNGIDYMGDNYKKLEEYKGCEFPLAVSIVISGQYEDDVDNLEDVWYTGQGGNDMLASKKQYKDQELSRGNLALQKSMEQSLPVRVIRGNPSGDKVCRKIYIYDGLYKVVQCLSEKGASGFIIYKFRLVRDPDQPKLTSDQVHFARAHKPYTSTKFPGLVSFDIAAGQEGIRVRAINTINFTAPTGFTYINSIQVSEDIEVPANAVGCKCEGSCTDETFCACAKLNGNEFPYVRLNGGRLIWAKDVVYECGPNCGCGPDCINRISQRKLKYKLEIFRTQEKGWAVRSGDFIPAGAPVCEYLGVLRKTDEVAIVSMNDYIFEIDCQHTMKGIGGRQRRSSHASVPTRAPSDNNDDKALADNAPEYCIDAGSVGSVSRFINHSCQPNLFVQCVLSSHHDPKLARIVLVAAENISPFEELTYDYGYELDSVAGPDGIVKKLPCHCGAAACRKRLY